MSSAEYCGTGVGTFSEVAIIVSFDCFLVEAFCGLLRAGLFLGLFFNVSGGSIIIIFGVSKDSSTADSLQLIEITVDLPNFILISESYS